MTIAGPLPWCGWLDVLFSLRVLFVGVMEFRPKNWAMDCVWHAGKCRTGAQFLILQFGEGGRLQYSRWQRGNCRFLHSGRWWRYVAFTYTLVVLLFSLSGSSFLQRYPKQYNETVK